MRKGQASLIDILLLGLFISVMLVLSLYLGNEHIRFQAGREDASYTSAMLQTAMSYRNATYGSYQNTMNLSVAEAINLYLCTNKISEADMNETLGSVLNSTVRPGHNYIFYTAGFVSSAYKAIWVWNSQPDVCARYVLVKGFGLEPSCQVVSYQQPILGIWPSWKEIPRKSACSEAGNPVG